MPKVSVIIPTHNRAKLLGSAIQSVLDQTYQDFELLVVDDGSEDNPEQVVRSFSDPRVRFVRHLVARGGGAARNTGIQNTSGPYVAFLDDDDTWYPQKLALQVAMLDQGPARLGLIYAGYDIVDPEGRTLSTRIPEARGDLRHKLLASNVIGGTSLILVRRTCLQSAGGFDEALPSFQDYDLYLRFSAICDFDFVPQSVSSYRRHEVQIWKAPGAILEGMEKMLEKHGTHKAFRESLAPFYLRLGRQLCVAGNRTEGQRAIRRGLLLNPRVFKGYAYYALAFLGANGFIGSSRIKAALWGPSKAKSH